jgi:hypothetical protein
MKTLICSLLARIFFNHPNFNFLEYSGLDFEPADDGDEVPVSAESVVGEPRNADQIQAVAAT